MNHGFEPPRELKPDWIEAIARCPAVDGVGSRTSTAHLTRWKAVFAGIEDWHRTGDGLDVIEERQFAWLDPVQKPIVHQLLSTYIQITPRPDPAAVDFDPAVHRVAHPTDNVQFVARSQFTISDNGQTEIVKIKTGRTRISPAETAVLLADLPERSSVSEVSLVDGVVHTLEMAPDTRETHIEALTAAWTAHRELAGRRKERKPGWYCGSCNRIARCGQYTTWTKESAGSRTRTMVVSKTWLERLPQCERRVAWRRIYGIPDDTGNDEDIDDRRSTGSHFHAAAATALLSDDPDQAFEHAIATAPASEHDTLRWLWDRHRELEATEPSPVSCGQTEYWGGVTLFVDGVDVDRRDQTIDARVAVVFTAALDAAGREPDGTPAIVEHRTGGHVSEPVFETDLYAVAGALAVRSDRIAVHIHRLGLQEGPECERVVYEADDLQAAVERLMVPAETIGGCHPDDALDPSYTVGSWCDWCEFQQRCGQFRSSPEGV